MRTMEEKTRNGVVITAFSTASAVGKTLLGINMAAELARNGYKVLLADLDLQFGDVCHYLHVTPRLSLYDALQPATDPCACITPYAHSGVEFAVLAAPLRLEEAYNVATPAVTALLTGLRRDYDYIVLDTAAAFSDLNLAVMDLSTIITFVGIVDFIPTIKNMKIGYDTMRSIGYDQNKIRLVLNRSNSKTHIELQDVEQLLEDRFYHVLPNQFAAAAASIHQGIPLVLGDAETALGKSLRELAVKYCNRLPEDGEPGGGSLTGWVKRLFR